MESAEAKAVLGQLKDHGRVRRWFGLGARAEELFDAFAKIKELSDWCREFGEVAKRFEAGADAAADRPVKLANYLSAASYYHIGLLGTFEDRYAIRFDVPRGRRSAAQASGVYGYTLAGAHGLANDMLIALSALSIGAVVITQNSRDFAAIQKIRPFKLSILRVH
jgi:hypothetical protein